MAQFRSTLDILDSVLRRAGETTNGNSAYESDALEYLNRAHHTIIAGGSIFNLDVDESWVWARSKSPMTIEIQPSISSGTVSVTLGSEAGSFSSAPASSLVGWFIKMNGRPEAYRIVTHVGGGSAFELDAAYLGATGNPNFTAYKLDYTLEPGFLFVNATNNKIDFEETAATQLTATLAAGSYTPSQLAAEVKTQLDAIGDSTYTVTYDSTLRLFTIASNRLGGGLVFNLKFGSGTNQANSSAALLGFDDEDLTNAASRTGKYPTGAISRLIEPIRIQKDSDTDFLVMGIDSWRFLQDYPTHRAESGLPTHFTKIEEDQDGRITIRFNKYPDEKRRIDINYVPVPRDLKDIAGSRPLFPRKDVDVLEFGATYFLLIDKEDSKADQFLALAQQGLKAMEKRNNDALRKMDTNFGEIVTRPEQIDARQRFRYGYTAGDQ